MQLRGVYRTSHMQMELPPKQLGGLHALGRGTASLGTPALIAHKLIRALEMENRPAPPWQFHGSFGGRTDICVHSAMHRLDADALENGRRRQMEGDRMTWPGLVKKWLQ